MSPISCRLNSRFSKKNDHRRSAHNGGEKLTTSDFSFPIPDFSVFQNPGPDLFFRDFTIPSRRYSEPDTRYPDIFNDYYEAQPSTDVQVEPMFHFGLGKVDWEALP